MKISRGQTLLVIVVTTMIEVPKGGMKSCIQWDSNPRQLRIRPERTALDHSAMNALDDITPTAIHVPTELINTSN